MNLGIDWHKLSFPLLLLGAVIFALLSIALNIAFPTPTSANNVALTIVLVIACVVALFIAHREGLAAQLIGWVVLAVIAGMVVTDNHVAGTLPIILYIPPVAAIAVNVLAGIRAVIPYCAGMMAVHVLAGVVYDRLGLSVAVAGVVMFGIAVDWIRRVRRRDRLTPLLEQFAGELHEMREIADEHTAISGK